MKAAGRTCSVGGCRGGGGGGARGGGQVYPAGTYYLAGLKSVFAVSAHRNLIHSHVGALMVFYISEWSGGFDQIILLQEHRGCAATTGKKLAFFSIQAGIDF